MAKARPISPEQFSWALVLSDFFKLIAHVLRGFCDFADRIDNQLHCQYWLNYDKAIAETPKEEAARLLAALDSDLSG